MLSRYFRKLGKYDISSLHAHSGEDLLLDRSEYFLFPIATNRKYHNGHPYSFQPFFKSWRNSRKSIINSPFIFYILYYIY